MNTKPTLINQQNARSAGVLLHISSLPGKYGIGSLGKAAYDFVDFLKKSGAKYWQLLP
ncbi:MAG: 4-alpha-glucanotransferase, partial [Clostridia bacterium]|nr:4-alpha-glucanotransferase [Clostridia bacterium]